jgi:DNA polymerase-1
VRRLGTALKSVDQRELRRKDEALYTLADDEWLDQQLQQRAVESLRQHWAQHKRRLQASRPLTGPEAQRVLFDHTHFYAPGEEPWARWAVTDPEQLENLYWYWAQFDRIALDFETDGLEAASATLVGAALGAGEHHVYLPLQTLPCDPSLAWEAHVRPLLLQLHALDPTWCFWHAHFDLTIWEAHGLPPIRRWEDGMIRCWTVHPHMPKGLKDQAEYRLGERRASYSQVAGKEKLLSEVPLAQAAQYAATDSQNTWDLEPLITQELADKGLQPQYERAKALLPVVQWMEGQGMPVDREALLARMNEALAFRDELLRRATAQVRELSGEAQLTCVLGDEDPPGTVHVFGQPLRRRGKRYPDRLNLRSTQQMSEFLFHRCGMRADWGSGIKSGINKSVLIRLRREGHAIAETLLLLSKVNKLLSGFYTPIKERLVHAAGWDWVFGRFHPWGPATGRWSSSSPNLQNICNPDPEHPWTLIRGAFRAPPGWKLVVGDLGQVELRGLAHHSQDPLLLKIFAEGGDVHAMTGAHLAGTSYETFRSWEPPQGVKPADFNELQARFVRFRKRAKPLNFGVSYMMGALKFSIYAADNFDVWWDPFEAAEQIDAWLGLYAGIPRYHDAIQRQILRRGYVETITGRRAYFDPLLQHAVLKGNKASHDYWLGERQWRQAVNFPIQGLAADLINAALRELYDYYYGSAVTVISQVHDEIIALAPEGMAEGVQARMQAVMEANQSLSLPITASVRIADNWLDAH